MTLVNLRGLSINDPQFLRVSIRQRVHRLKSEVEAVVGMIDSGDGDPFVLVRYVPARPTRCGVPTLDSLGSTDVGERWQ